MDDWLKVKHMYIYDDSRVNWDAVEEAKRMQLAGTLICARIPGGFSLPRELMGDEAACLCYYDQPELMHDILGTVTETSFITNELISRHLTFDCLCVHEDMAGKSGPIVGPDTIREFILPHYRRNWDMLRSRGTKMFLQDSDGNMNSVIDIFIECGVNVFYPCEPAAGMDIVQLRKKYGNRIAMMGGIDKHVLRQGREVIKRELEYKLQPLMQGGGMCFGLDHRIPNMTPLDDYRYYVQTARDMLGLHSLEKGWGRMAL